jgi:hypothetical protein
MPARDRLVLRGERIPVDAAMERVDPRVAGN